MLSGALIHRIVIIAIVVLAAAFGCPTWEEVLVGAVQAWPRRFKTGSLEPRACRFCLTQFHTVLGEIDFDDKGDLTVQSRVGYV